MTEVYCQYNGCKEVADFKLPIKYKTYKELLVCTKHKDALVKKMKIRPEKIEKLKTSTKLKKIFRKFKRVKNLTFNVERR